MEKITKGWCKGERRFLLEYFSCKAYVYDSWN